MEQRAFHQRCARNSFGYSLQDPGMRVIFALNPTGLATQRTGVTHGEIGANRAERRYTTLKTFTPFEHSYEFEVCKGYFRRNPSSRTVVTLVCEA